MHVTLCGTQKNFDVANKNRRRRHVLEKRLRGCYAKAYRRIEHLSADPPFDLDTRIVITDVFNDVGHPVEVFYSDETPTAFARRGKEDGELSADEARRRHGDCEFAEQVLAMAVNDYVCHLPENVGRMETDLAFERWHAAKNQMEASLE